MTCSPLHRLPLCRSRLEGNGASINKYNNYHRDYSIWSNRHAVICRTTNNVLEMFLPSLISWTALTMDWKPDPHSLLTMYAGRSTGTPHRRAVCLAEYTPGVVHYIYTFQI